MGGPAENHLSGYGEARSRIAPGDQRGIGKEP